MIIRHYGDGGIAKCVQLMTMLSFDGRFEASRVNAGFSEAYDVERFG